MDLIFPFEYIGKDTFGEIWRPTAIISLKSPVRDVWVSVWMIVDTGADYTIIPRHFSEKLRISLNKDCIKDKTYGVGGNQTIYFVKSQIKVLMGKIERSIPLAFFDTNEVPALLGRQGFLETFDTTFTKSHKVIFKN